MVCAQERALLDQQGHALVVGHGDLKPTNVLASESAEDMRVVLIDFELAGPNFRGFDLCKLFRNDAGQIDIDPSGPLCTFLSEYRDACALRTTAPMPSVEELAAEAAALEPATWLEAAVFFMTVLSEEGFTEQQYEVAERLSSHRWERYLSLRPQFRQ